ncbi:MAG: ABC transporter ATP-binding protein [Chloroflexi bacterium]|nr:ABC transporter ATP-binding protein [Chloroflexota bacterium]
MGRGDRKGATVTFEHASKYYGASPGPSPAVDDLSLQVEPGEVCVLVGPSGCGKTTSLKMVNRLVEPSSGRVLIDGTDVAAVDAVSLRRSVGYVIQQVGLFPHQTVAENVGTVPKLLGWPRARINARIDELMDLVGLDPDQMRNRYPAQLSGGERQRVGLARAMAAEPPVMLMDEPFAAVDPLVRERLQDELLRIQRQLGTTVLFVTHDINEALKMGTRVAVMEQGGHLAQYSPPAEILARPATEYVARFVGADRALKSLALRTLGQMDLEARRGSAEIQDQSISLGADQTVRDALSALLAAGRAEGPVFGSDGRFLGFFTLDALVKSFVREPESSGNST